MKITFIGCGDSFAHTLGNNSALVEWQAGHLLIDLPDSNYARMLEMGMDYSTIDHVFITHLHGDHMNGLERFAYYRQFATPVVCPEKAGTKAHLYVPETLYHGLWDSVKHGLGITQQGMKTLEDYFHVHRIPIDDGIGEFRIGEQTFYLTPSNHVPHMPVYGLFVKGEFYYSADSTFDASTFSHYANHVKKIFHDMHFYPQDLASHASVRDFSSLDEAVKEKVYAMHYDESKKDVQKVDGIQLVKPFQTIHM